MGVNQTEQAEKQLSPEEEAAAQVESQRDQEDLRLAIGASEEKRQAEESKKATEDRLEEEERLASEWQADADALKADREKAEKTVKTEPAPSGGPGKDK
jgi:hypothetical protein